MPNPILMVRDEHDTVIHDFEPGCLEAALEHGLSPSVTSVTLLSPEGTEGHRFEGSSESLVDTVAGWLAKLD